MVFPKTDEERKALIKRLAGKKISSEGIERGSGRLPEKCWDMPRARVSNGASLEILSEDREEDR